MLMPLSFCIGTVGFQELLQLQPSSLEQKIPKYLPSVWLPLSTGTMRKRVERSREKEGREGKMGLGSLVLVTLTRLREIIAALGGGGGCAGAPPRATRFHLF